MRSDRKSNRASDKDSPGSQGIDYILLHSVDMLGLLRGRAIPASELEDAVKQGVGFDGSSIPGYVGIEESDMLMKLDPSTMVLLPDYFYNRSVANIICDVFRPGGKRLESDSRHVCLKATENLRKVGYEPTAAAEVEFYLVKNGDNGQIEPVENHVSELQRYFDISPGRDLTETFRMDLCDALSLMGITVERQHHEVGSAQSEVTFKYSTPLTTGDNVVRYKFAARAVANKKYGWTVTFMPKPWFGKPGSGMHVHLGLASENPGVNPFFDPDKYACVSQMCRYFIGGLLDHARALCAIVAPTVNSYKRLVPGYEAPVYIAWSRGNRSALVRVPYYFPGNEREARVEFRSPDPLCNPYLAYAVLFEAGLDGINKKLEPGDPVNENVYHLSEAKRKELGIETLPTSLKEALEEWGSDEICVRVLGRENAEKYRQLKMGEWKEYESQEPRVASDRNKVTDWELKKYLLA